MRGGLRVALLMGVLVPTTAPVVANASDTCSGARRKYFHRFQIGQALYFGKLDDRRDECGIPPLSDRYDTPEALEAELTESGTYPSHLIRAVLSRGAAKEARYSAEDLRGLAEVSRSPQIGSEAAARRFERLIDWKQRHPCYDPLMEAGGVLPEWEGCTLAIEPWMMNSTRLKPFLLQYTSQGIEISPLPTSTSPKAKSAPRP